MNVPHELLSEQDALTRIHGHLKRMPPREVRLLDALARYSAREYLARLPMPAFDNSAMDGYAVRAADCTNGALLTVIAEQPAGVAVRDLTVAPGTAIRILSGAPVPAGADAVIMQEDVERSGDSIVVMEPVSPGENVRSSGSEVCAGQKILSAGDPITASVVALLAAQGLQTIQVFDAPRISVVTTGDELVPSGEPLRPGQIHDSNGPMIAALLKQIGLCPEAVLHAADNPADMREVLFQGLKSDILIVCGGVSVGDRDLVRPVLEKLGASTGFWRVAVKPGKPFLFATRGETVIFGLPGNPVSSFVAFQLFVRSAILRMLGAGELDSEWRSCRCTGRISNPGNRTFYVRGQLGGGEFIPAKHQGSHSIAALAKSNAMARLLPGVNIEAGEAVDVWRW